jgi:hypothetical protein
MIITLLGDENFKWMLRIDEKICKIGYNEKEINCNIENIYSYGNDCSKLNKIYTFE